MSLRALIRGDQSFGSEIELLVYTHFFGVQCYLLIKYKVCALRNNICRQAAVISRQLVICERQEWNVWRETLIDCLRASQISCRCHLTLERANWLHTCKVLVNKRILNLLLKCLKSFQTTFIVGLQRETKLEKVVILHGWVRVGLNHSASFQQNSG